MAPKDLLERDVYSVAEAARLVRRNESTIRWWLKGQTQRGQFYEPVLRDTDDDHRWVRWGEFVSIAFLDYLRRSGVRSQAVRDYMDHMTMRYGRDFPLARRDVLINGAELAWLTESGYVEDTKRQVFAEPEFVEAFIGRLTWEGGVATDLLVNEAFPNVRVNPMLRFGAPQIAGRTTAIIRDLYDAGETIDSIVELHGVSAVAAQEAIEFEGWLRSRAPARV